MKLDNLGKWAVSVDHMLCTSLAAGTPNSKRSSMRQSRASGQPKKKGTSLRGRRGGEERRANFFLLFWEAKAGFAGRQEEGAAN